MPNASFGVRRSGVDATCKMPNGSFEMRRSVCPARVPNSYVPLICSSRLPSSSVLRSRPREVDPRKVDPRDGSVVQVCRSAGVLSRRPRDRGGVSGGVSGKRRGIRGNEWGNETGNEGGARETERETNVGARETMRKRNGKRVVMVCSLVRSPFRSPCSPFVPRSRDPK